MAKRPAKGKPPAVPQVPPLEVNRLEARTILGGVAERTFARLESDGIIAPSKRGRGGRASVYDLRQLVPAYIGFISAQRPADDRDARSRRDRSQAELNELTLQTKRKELVSRDQVRSDGQAYVKAWVAQVRSLPRRMTQGGLIPRQQEPAVVAMCREIVQEIQRCQSIGEVALLSDGDPA